MNKTTQGILIALVVLIILYIIYRYMFQNKIAIDSSLQNYNIPNSPHVKPVLTAPSGVIDTNIINQNQNTDYGNVQNDLPIVLKVLGYNVNPPDSNGDVIAIGYYNYSDILKKFALRFPGNQSISDGAGNKYLVDNDKWLAYQPLTYIKYNIKDNQTAFDYYQKIIAFWGKDFFGNLSAQRITEAAKNVNKVDCNSQEYKDKLLKLAANLKDAESKYQIAVININNVDNAETTQALNRTSKILKDSNKEYQDYFKLCKTN